MGFITALVLSSFASAALLTGEGKGPVIEKVVTSQSAQSGATRLQLVGAGLRAKKVAFIKVRAYVAELFAADPAAWKRDENEAAVSLAQQSWALRLHFLRDVDAAKVSGSFKEALEANKVDLTAPGIKEFLKAVEAGGDAKEGQVLSFLFDKDKLTYEAPNGTLSTIIAPKGFATQILSIWLGTPADSGLTELKKSLLQIPQGS